MTNTESKLQSLYSNITKVYTYIQSETRCPHPIYNPVSGLMNRAEKANARKTIPPMIVTVETKQESTFNDLVLEDNNNIDSVV